MSVGRARRRGRRLATLVACVAVATGCRRASPVPIELAPAVEIAGCAGWVHSTTCELGGDRTLRVWVGPSPSPVRLHAGGALLAPSSTSAIAGGELVTVAIPPGATALEFRPTDARYVVRARFVLADAKPPARVAEAKRLRAAGKKTDALALLGSLEGLDAAERAAALALRARLRLDVGAVEAAIDDFRAAIAQREPARVSDRVDDAAALAFVLTERSHRFAEAKQVLAEASERVGVYPEGRARIPYYRGLVAYETGDLRSSLLGFDEAEERATRLAMTPLVRLVRQARALGLLALGRQREALDVLVKLRAEAGSAVGCDGVDLAINLSWAFAACGRAEARALCGVDADEALRRASETAAEAARAFPATCADPHRVANALVNGALARLLGNDATGALELLTRSRKSVDEPSAAVTLYWLEVEGRAELARGDARRALAVFERERALAESLHAEPMRWRAELGVADARERLGDVRAALEAYRRAEDAVAGSSLWIPLGEGRASFLAERDEATARHVRLLRRERRDDDALAVLRRARLGVLGPLEWARSLARLEPASRARWEVAVGAYRQERATLEGEAAREWSLPQTEFERAKEARTRRDALLRKRLDEALSAAIGEGRDAAHARLREPATGEVLLAYQRVDAGWIGWARSLSGTVSTALRAVDVAAPPEALASVLLEPFSKAIDAATRITVLATGALHEVDFHALPWRGRALVLHAEVAYGLDLPPNDDASEAPSSAAAAGRAFVVGDPTSDLPAALAEAEAASSALARAGFRVDTLMRGAALGRAVRAGLGVVELFHYAGHGAFAGRDGWESALPLAESGKLAVGDLLALPRAPRLVVLAGCETGRSGAPGGASALGLAQAFLVAGSEQVLASTRKIDDNVTKGAMDVLYARAPGERRTDLVTRLAETQRELSKRPGLAGWKDLRVFVR